MEWRQQAGGPDVPCPPTHLTAFRRGPLIQFRPAAPAQRAPQRQAANHSVPGEPETVATPQARAPPAPTRQTPKPLIKQGDPAGEIGRGFRAAKERLTLHRPKPPPPKKSKRGGEDEKGRPPAALNKKLVMKFKMAWCWLTGARDNRPAFDYETYQREQQSAALDNEHERGFRHGGPKHPSPNP